MCSMLFIGAVLVAVVSGARSDGLVIRVGQWKHAKYASICELYLNFASGPSHSSHWSENQLNMLQTSHDLRQAASTNWAQVVTRSATVVAILRTKCAHYGIIPRRLSPSRKMCSYGKSLLSSARTEQEHSYMSSTSIYTAGTLASAPIFSKTVAIRLRPSFNSSSSHT